jgi:hypothetical protein
MIMSKYRTIFLFNVNSNIYLSDRCVKIYKYFVLTLTGHVLHVLSDLTLHECIYKISLIWTLVKRTIGVQWNTNSMYRSFNTKLPLSPAVRHECQYFQLLSSDVHICDTCNVVTQVHDLYYGVPTSTGNMRCFYVDLIWF